LISMNVKIDYDKDWPVRLSVYTTSKDRPPVMGVRDYTTSNELMTNQIFIYICDGEKLL